jgi:hypothetical protein
MNPKPERTLGNSNGASSPSGFRTIRANEDDSDMVITNPAPEASPPATASGTTRDIKVVWQP